MEAAMTTPRSPLSKVLLLGATLACGLSGVGCDDPQQGWEPAGLDRSFSDVYPVLIRDCGFHACHGDQERFFRVYGPGRARLDDRLRAYEQVTGEELSISFSIALSMIDTEHPERSPLLVKPLALEAGGAAHGGIDDFGRNVYRTKEDEGYKALERFVLGIAEEEDEEE
jgi:hypothetical protein